MRLFSRGQVLFAPRRLALLCAAPFFGGRGCPRLWVHALGAVLMRPWVVISVVPSPTHAVGGRCLGGRLLPLFLLLMGLLPLALP